MAYMLDTNTVSYILKSKSVAARDRFREVVDRDPDGVAISVVTEAELRYGLAKRPNAHRLHTAIETFLAKIPVLVWGGDEAKAYAKLRVKMEARGLSLAGNDMLIAAHAVSTGFVLAANDKAFFQLKGLLRVERWATDISR